MRHLAYIGIILGIIYFLKIFQTTDTLISGQLTYISGYILIGGYLFATIIKKIKLPRLSGYMIIGIISGPYILNIVSHQIIVRLEFLESLALSFIALNAGGEFRLKQFASNRKGIIYILIFQIVVVFIGAGLAFYAIGKNLDFLSKVSNEIIFGFAILFATVSVSKSPATTIGIITELNAKGKVTDTILSVTILKSIVIVLLFPLLVGWAKIYLQVGEQNSFESILPAFYQILNSIIIGLIVGFLTVFYLSKTREGIGLYLLGVTLILAELSSLIGLEILLSSMIVGIVVQNFSKYGDSMIKGLELFSLPIYISFFFLTGASLHLDVVIGAIFVTMFLVISRMILIFFGTFIGAKLAKESKINKNYSWMGYIGQAGIALGLSILIEKSVPGIIGQSFIAIVIATVVINELIGPILFKYVLNKAKETNEDELFTNKYYSRLRRNNT